MLDTNFCRLVQGPRVEIFVGKERKLFTAPKALLCYYSKVFDRCFNGNFKEAQTQKLELPEDNSECFEALLLFMLQGKVTKVLGTKFAIESSEMVQRCLEFLQYTDKFNLGSMGADMVYEPLREVWGFVYDRDDAVAIGGVEIEVVFAIAPIGHPLRNLVLRTALTCQIDASGELLPENHLYLKQEAEVEGFAAGLLNLIFVYGGVSLDFETVRNLAD